MNLFRAVVDKGIVDRHGHKAGKVDDILLELREGKRPVVRAIVSGQGALSSLLGSTVARMIGWLRGQILGEDAARPKQIRWEHVTRIDVVVHLDLDRQKAGLIETEDILWERWIKRLPFAER